MSKAQTDILEIADFLYNQEYHHKAELLRNAAEDLAAMNAVVEAAKVVMSSYMITDAWADGTPCREPSVSDRTLDNNLEVLATAFEVKK